MIQRGKTIRTWAMAIALATNFTIQAQTTLKQGFSTPPDSVSLWCYYYWISDNVSEKGITRDLEAMKKFGIGAALIGNIGQPDVPYGKVKILTEPWYKATEHAIREGAGTGVDIGLFNCPGWSQSGGPWVKATDAMRYLAMGETTVTGPVQLNKKLSVPAANFQDVTVLAFPAPDNDHVTIAQFSPVISAEPTIAAVQNLVDGSTVTAAMFPADKLNQPFTIDIHTQNPFTARSITVQPIEKEFMANCELWIKDHQGTYVPVKSFLFERRNAMLGVGFKPYGPVTFSFDEVTSTDYRLVVKNIVAKDKKSAGFAEIEISPAPRLESYIEKQLGKMCQTPFPLWNEYQWPVQPETKTAGMTVATKNVIDISKYLKDSVLTWSVPTGKWIIQRFGMVPTGAQNDPSAPNATGYEVDKMNKTMLAKHFEAYVGQFLNRMPASERKAFKYVIGDSYEKGSQNWTDGFAADFTNKYGYDPLPYLPVLSGRVVNTAECSDRFLWDLRRLVADRVAYDYVGGMRGLCEKNNLTMWLENYGHWGFPGEFLQYGGQSQLVSGEFWNEGTLGNIECKAAVSAAHIYGKPRVSAEAFTAAGLTYQRHPAMLKKRGDWAFTEGINHFVLHLYIQQPDERVPGVNAWFSTEFNRHNTWFEQGKAYADYLRRCMFMLQQGKPVTDVAYFIGEDAPKMTGVRNPELPEGYSYDYINAEALMNRVTIENGQMVFPDGFRCSMLVLPQLKTMRPELLQRIKYLVNRGLIVYGPAPEKSPSLQNYPQCDQTVNQIATELWGDQKAASKKTGQGIVYNNIGLKEALISSQIMPDVELPEKLPVLWVHRQLPDADIYFLTNQSDRPLSFAPSFRASGCQPEFWDAMTGENRELPQFLSFNNRTIVPITLTAAQSGFIVLRKGSRKADLSKENFPELHTVKTINTPWQVQFEAQAGGPAKEITFDNLTDWTVNSLDAIKYYSGTAVYKTSFDYAGGSTKTSIDLGNVGVMATITINGTQAGTVWMAPYRLDVTKWLKTGSNTLEIKVVNVWANRLIGDSKLPEKARKTWTPVNPYKPGDTLTPSGLTGPVTLMSEE